MADLYFQNGKRDHVMSSDTNKKVTEALENTGLFYWILKSMKQFNDQEVIGVITGQLKTSDGENCFLLTYWRTVYNVNSMLELADVRHFQTIANLARTMLELAADAHLLSIIPDSIPKLLYFNRLERLRAARGILKYESAHTISMPLNTSPYKSFVATQGQQIEHDGAMLWPNLKLRSLRHWTGLSLDERTKLVGQPLEEIYQLYNRMLSWYVHSGGSGVMGLPPETFPVICSLGYRVAALTFEEVIMQVAKEFKLTVADDSIGKKLEYAKALPLTATPEQELQLAKELGLM
jgi:hypothetical protein